MVAIVAEFTLTLGWPGTIYHDIYEISNINNSLKVGFCYLPKPISTSTSSLKKCCDVPTMDMV